MTSCRRALISESPKAGSGAVPVAGDCAAGGGGRAPGGGGGGGATDGHQATIPG